MIQQIREMYQNQQTVPRGQVNGTPGTEREDSFQSLLLAASASKSAPSGAASQTGKGKDTGAPHEGKGKDVSSGAAQGTAQPGPTAVPVAPGVLPETTVPKQAAGQAGTSGNGGSESNAGRWPFTVQALSGEVKTVPTSAAPQAVTEQGPASGLISAAKQVGEQTQPSAGQSQPVFQPIRQPAGEQEPALNRQGLPARQNAPSEALGTQQVPEDQPKTENGTLQTQAVFSALADESGSTVRSESKNGIPAASAENKQDPLQVENASDKNKDSSEGPKVSSNVRKLNDFYSDGKVVVKVSDPPAKAQVPVNRQVSNAVLQGVKAGKQQLQVDLYPQSLGKVAVKLTSENGILTVEIAASNPKTQSLLASSSGEIKSMLQSSTGRTIQMAGPEQQTRQNDQQQDRQGYQDNSRRQDRQEKQKPKWYSVRGTDEISTDDFLSLLRQTSTAG